MTYPIHLSTFQDGLEIYIPVEEQIKPTYEKLLSLDELTAFPFWAKLWPSSKALSQFLKNAPHLTNNKTILEIGAGIGLPSFIIARHVSEMIISDYAPEAVCLLEKNIQYLELNRVKAMCIDWNKLPADIKADVLLLSDINYAPDQFESLFKLISQFLKQNTTVIIATPQRITTSQFAALIQPYIKDTILYKITEKQEQAEIIIFLLSINC